MPFGQKMRVPLDQGDRRPSTLDLEPQQVAMERIAPARPDMAQIVRAQIGIEARSLYRATPRRLDLAAALARTIGIWLRRRLACVGLSAFLALPLEDGARPVRQRGERSDDGGRHVRDPAAASLCAPESDAAAREVHIAPVELERLSHAPARADQ